jgi:hypothetical protein
MPVSAVSKPGVWGPLLTDEERVYEELLHLSWPWALQYVSTLSFGKRLTVDSIPNLDVLAKSTNLVGVGGSCVGV